MKKFILLYCIVISHLTVFAQTSFNDNINLGSTTGDLHTIATPGAWARSHGTPSYLGPGSLWMWGQDRIGEGVYRSVVITPNTEYLVRIGINEFVASSGMSNFTVLLANDFIPNECIGAGCTTPPGMFTNSRVLFVYSGGSFSGQILNLRFATAPGETYSRIVIYPGAVNALPVANTQLNIGCLNVFGCVIPADEFTFCGTVNAGTYDANNIKIGSSFCGTSGEATVASGSTLFRAVHQIEVRNNTTISGSNGPVTLEVVSNNCYTTPSPSGQVAATWDMGGCRPTLQLNALQTPIANNDLSGRSMIGNLDPGKLNIYPNPTDGILNIQVNIEQAGSVTVLVTDLTGRKMQQQFFENREAGLTTLKMNLNGLAQGTYVVELRTADGKKAVSKVQLK